MHHGGELVGIKLVQEFVGVFFVGQACCVLLA
jgi:hypothetical protein